MKQPALLLAFVAGLSIVVNPRDCNSQQTLSRKKDKAVEATPRTGRISGVVIDSLDGGGLANADVLAEGKTVAFAHTDSAGNFVMPDVPTGKYHLTVSHPLLDALGVSLITPEFFVMPESTSLVSVGIPGSSRLIELKCKGRPVSGPSAIIGRVLSTDSISPLSKVAVSVSWTTYDVSKEAGVVKTNHIVRDTTGASGAYKICGLPSDLQADLEANVAGNSLAHSQVSVPSSEPSLLVATLYVPAASGAVSPRTVRLTGRVELPNGEPAHGSSVELDGSPRRAIVDQRGKFTLDSVPVGTQTIRARQLGYQEASLVLDVAPSAGEGIVLKMQEAIPVLSTVSVSATLRERALHKVGFDQRSQHSVGHFLTADQIAEKGDFQFTDLLRGIPGIAVGIDKYGDDVVSSGRAGGSLLNETHGCVQYFVDGVQWGNAAMETRGTVGDKDNNKRLSRLAVEVARQLNTVLRKSDVIGIEVYQGGGAPAYFNQGGRNCAIVVIWTIASLSR